VLNNAACQSGAVAESELECGPLDLLAGCSLGTTICAPVEQEQELARQLWEFEREHSPFTESRLDRTR